jgi:ABC-type antimicrobial peptide transport system permease subunit
LRALRRRKTKNISAILAVTLGVTLLVGIQITTDTLKNSFLTSLLQGEGEVDIRVTNATTGGYLTAADAESISALVPEAVGIMPELSMRVAVMLDSQFDDSVELAGISTDFPEAFGSFYDWKTGDELDLDSLLVSNTSILLSSDQAEKLGLTEETSLPVSLTTEFTNLTATVVEPPVVPLSDWIVNSNFTTVEYVLNSSVHNLSLELEQAAFPGMPSVVTLYTMNCSRLSLSDYACINVTATGTDNAIVVLGFSMVDGSSFNVTNLADVDTLNTVLFDLAPYAGKTLRGDAYLVIMSSDGMPASIDISEIAFETSKPVISYTSEIERTDLQVVGIFDSNHPGIGSQYPGAVLKLEHLQQWMNLQDTQKETDRVEAYLVALKTDHFTSEISEDYLKEQVDTLKNAIPEQTNSLTNDPNKIYSVSAPRLTFFNVAEFIMTLLSSMLTALGLLIMITGVLLITNIQLMSVEDREFQTGVLRAVGENKRGIFQSMLIENIFQGILGGLLGLAGGLAFGQAVALYLASLFGTGELSVQPVISQQVVILSVIIGVTLSIITGLLPALRASRVNIVEALRGIKVSFEEKSNRNLVALGILALIGGCAVLSINGVLDTSSQVLWSSEGWDTLDEWRTILIGTGLLSAGLGIVLSHFIDRVKAFNITAIALWIMPAILFVVAMGNWIPNITDISVEILMIGIIETIIGSVLFVALNLPIVMRGLRRIIIKIRGFEGVAQISPALISSHKSRSTLTFAIFAVILTLNVLVATLIPTNLGTVTQTEEDSRGIDLFVSLNKPESVLNETSYTEELYKLDPSITDVIGLRTYRSTTDFTKFTALKNPRSSGFNPSTDLLPIGAAEFDSEQIRGNATNSSIGDWRYDFYLSSFPDGVRQNASTDISDEELLDMSKESWDLFFDPDYRMPAYNVSLDMLSFFSGENDLGDVDITNALSGFGGDYLEGVSMLRDENGNVIENPIVFTDSFILPLGMQIWLPMNASNFGVPNYQAFTIGGKLDSQRAGGFPMASSGLGGGNGDISAALGMIYIPEQWANQTAFFAETNMASASRTPDQFDYYLVKTSYAIDDKQIASVAQAIEEFTNTNDHGYRALVNDNFVVASATVLYSKVEASMEMVTRLISFLQIYVTFGLVIGAVGMGIISVRNVAERKREIGMMRAIGFPKTQVMTSVLLELVVLGVIGLLIGIVNGLLISVGFANMQNATLVIPWSDLCIYLSLITLIALGAGAVPGWLASRIPPAESLRYVG